MRFFIGTLVFFIAMLLTLAFTIFLYIRLVIAVQHNSAVPQWMYKLGRALKGRERRNSYEDFTDQSVLNDIHAYIIGVIIASIAVYFMVYDRNSANNKVMFWVNAEFLIIIGMRAVVFYGKLLLIFIHPKKKYDRNFSSAANAVINMILMSAFACMVTFSLTGLPVKAPVVQVGDYKIIVGQTTADDLLSNGFSFIGEEGNTAKNTNDMIVNKRNSHLHYGETARLVKDGKGYGYVNLTPGYKDKAKLGDCVITYFGITAKSKRPDDIKICDKNISELSLDDCKKENMTDIFSLSPISYREIKGYKLFSLKMQTYPHMLWKSYTIEVTFFDNDQWDQFEVYAQHTLWE